MTFIVRQISHTADGREIIRSATHEGDTLIIGRDPANAIHLPDLAVEMQHARITRGARAQLVIEALTGLAFECDGQSVMRAECYAASGTELRFGSQRLTITLEGDAVVIAVSRAEAASEGGDDSARFLLAGLLPGRRVMAWGLIAAVLMLFLGWPIYTWAVSQGVKERPAGFHADRMWSSGPLSLAHKSLGNDCQACHVKAFEAVADRACIACHVKDAHPHAPVARLINAKAPPGIGGSMQGAIKSGFGIPQGRCVECHSEHEGAARMEPTAQQFCTDCHASLDQRLRDTRLKNANDFGTGHPHFSPAITINPGGAQRQTRRVPQTGPISEDNGLKFPHDIHLSRTNGIARMAQTMAEQQGWGDALACKDCHTPSADGTRFKPVEMEKNCAMCHSLGFDRVGGTIRTLRHGQTQQVVADLQAYYRSTTPERPINLSGMARRRPGDYAASATANDYAAGARAWSGRGDDAVRAVFSRGGACFDCHVVTPNVSGWQVRKVFQPARYFEKGWFDHDAHQTEKCGSCHKAETSSRASDLLIPDLASCRACHVGGNGAHLKPVARPVKSSCAMCHDYHADPGAPWLVRERAARAKGRGDHGG